MKKSLIILFFVLLVTGLMSPSAFGQQFYVGFDAGYGLKINTSNYGWYNDNVDQNGSVSTYENVRYSLGQGFQIGVSAGYMFNENLGVEAGVAYQSGAPVNTHYFISDSSGTTKLDMKYSLSAQSIRISPALIMQIKPDATFSPFIKMGLIFSMASMEEIHEGVDFSGDFKKSQWNYTKGLNLGVMSSLGAICHLNDKLDVVGEIKIQLLNYAPERRVYSEYSINGIDQLSGMTTSDKEIEYVNSYSYDQNNIQPATEPSTWLKELYSLNSYGFHIGLRFNL